jgi:hypothetical protein
MQKVQDLGSAFASKSLSKWGARWQWSARWELALNSKSLLIWMHRTESISRLIYLIGSLSNLKKNSFQKCLKIILESMLIIRKNMKPRWIK